MPKARGEIPLDSPECSGWDGVASVQGNGGLARAARDDHVRPLLSEHLTVKALHQHPN